MNPGKLIHRIVIQQRTTSPDTSGGQLETWANISTIWSRIESLTARELVAAQAVQSEVSHSITIRWQPAFADPKAVAAMRAVYGTRIFNITGGLNLSERNRELTLLATEGLNQG